MDDPFIAFAMWLGKLLGVHPLTIIGFFPIIVLVCNLISKVIPDDATGWKGVVRKITSVLGAAINNRVTGNITTTDVAAVVLAERGVPVSQPKVQSAFEKVESTIEEIAEPMELDVMNPAKPNPLFPGIGRDPTTGRFTKIESPLWVGLACLALLALLSGCMTMPSTPCGKAAYARQAAVETIKAIDMACPAAKPVEEEGIN